MTWYNQNPKWKQFLQKDYSAQSLLLNKQEIELIKQMPLQPQLQAYIHKHRKEILQDMLRYCLQFPKSDSCYDRKFLYPTKAIELMTNEVFFSFLGWDKQLLKTYLATLFKNLATIDPHYQNVNLYHGYFQRLFKMFTKNAKNFMSQTLEIIAQEQKICKFIDLLLKFSHKLSIANCLFQLLIIDLTHSSQLALLNLKQNLINQIMKLFGQYVSEKQVQEQQVQNCLVIIKLYFEESFHYTKDKSNPYYKENIASFNLLGSKLIKSWSFFIDIITKRQENCLKLRVFQILQVYEMQKGKLSLNGFTILACQKYKQQLINYMFNKKFGITHSHFYQWLIIAFSNLGENENQITLFLQKKVVQKALSLLVEYKTNSILAFRIFVLLKMIFVNIEREIQLKISRHVNTGCEIVQFRLLNEFFKHFSTIENIVKSFKSYNEYLFIHMIVTIKFFTENAYNIISNFNNFSNIPICNTSKTYLQRLIELYLKQACFKLYQTEISKDLGTFFTDDLFKDKAPLQYEVKKMSQQVGRGIQKQDKQRQVKLGTNFSFSQTEKTIVPQIQNTVIQLKFDNSILDLGTIADQKRTQKIQSNTQIPAPDKENQEELDKTYEKYLKKNMLQVQSIVQQQKRCKSRTPTKIKSDIKKSKNRWLDQSNTSVKSNQAPDSIEKVSKTLLKLSPQSTKQYAESNLPKIRIIKVSKKHLQNREIRERVLNEKQRDQKLYKWINLLRQLR